MTDKTPSSELGEMLAEVYIGLVQEWKTAGPEAVYAQLESLSPVMLRSLIMVTLAADV